MRLSPRLRAKYPEEMTIVLQHQFWDLVVTEDGFEVGMSFGGVAERLLVPFDAIKGFLDPSVQFGLQFEEIDERRRQRQPKAGASERAQPSKHRAPSARPRSTSAHAASAAPPCPPPANPTRPRAPHRQR